MENENGFRVNEDELQALEGTEGNKKSAKISKELFDWVETIAVALITVVIIFTFFFRIATIVGPSMQNTLYSGERVVISNLFYEPEFGDIVVVSRNTNNAVNSNSNDPIIKRVIATEGQYVDIDFVKGKVYVGDSLNNMQELAEPYVKTPTNRMYDVEFPLYVKEGYIFVFGDNRNDSVDSRSSTIGEGGLIDKRYVLGKAIYRIWPFESIGGLYENE